jgi:hypothetical protein
MTDALHGRIHIHTQGGHAALQRDQLASWIGRQNNNDGMHATRIGPSAPSRTDDVKPTESSDSDEPPGQFGPVEVTVRPRGLEELKRVGFDDRPSHRRPPADNLAKPLGLRFRRPASICPHHAEHLIRRS